METHTCGKISSLSVKAWSKIAPLPKRNTAHLCRCPLSSAPLPSAYRGVRVPSYSSRLALYAVQQAGSQKYKNRVFVKGLSPAFTQTHRKRHCIGGGISRGWKRCKCHETGRKTKTNEVRGGGEEEKIEVTSLSLTAHPPHLSLNYFSGQWNVGCVGRSLYLERNVCGGCISETRAP